MDLVIWKCTVAYAVNLLDIDLIAENEYVTTPKYILEKISKQQKWDNSRALVQKLLTAKKNQLKKLVKADGYKTLLTSDKYEKISNQVIPLDNLFPHNFVTAELAEAQSFAVEAIEEYVKSGLTVKNKNRNVKGKVKSILGEFAVDDNNKGLVDDLMKSINQLSRQEKKEKATADKLFNSNTINPEFETLLDEQTKRNSLGYEILANSNNNKLAEMEKRATLLERIVFDQILLSFNTLTTLHAIDSPLDYDREAVKVCSTTIGLLLRVFPQLQSNYVRLTGLESFTNFHQTITGLTSAGYRVFSPEQYAELENYVKGQGQSEDEISKSNEGILREEYLRELEPETPESTVNTEVLS